MQFLKRGFKYWNKPERAAYLFLLPSLLILLLFTAIPLVATVGISFMKLDIFLKSMQFRGMENYSTLWQDERFWNAAKNTLYFTGLEMPLQIVASLFTAVVVAKNTRVRKMLRSVYFLPSICSMTAIGILWAFLLDPQLGMYPYLLTKLGLPQLQFLRDPVLAMPSVILLTIWRNFGYTMIILVSGLQAIPENYYEAAQMDGASRLNQFFRIELPMIIPSLGFCIVTTTISALQVFDQIFVTTQGGPINKTETVVNYIYNVGFKLAPYDLGYASSISVFLLGFIMVVVLGMNRFLMRDETTAG